MKESLASPRLTTAVGLLSEPVAGRVSTQPSGNAPLMGALCSRISQDPPLEAGCGGHELAAIHHGTAADRQQEVDALALDQGHRLHQLIVLGLAPMPGNSSHSRPASAWVNCS